MKHVSPLRYPGGKSCLAPLLADIMVMHDLHDGAIVEPFAGGAGAALHLMLDEYAYYVVLNDADYRIYAFWRALLNQTEQLAEKIETADVTMDTWYACREIYDAPKSRHRQIDIAFAVFFLNRCNRSGILMNSGPIGGKEQKGKWKLDARFNREELAQRIRRIASYRDRISAFNLDAVELLESLDTSLSDTLIFLDPPYYHKGQRLYMNAMRHDDHVRLADFLRSNPPFHWVVTYDNTPEIRAIYEGFQLTPFELYYSAQKKTMGKELLIADPRLDVPVDLLEYHSGTGRMQFMN